MPFSSNYNFIERALHYFAFSVPLVQKVLAELENDFFKRKLEGVDSSGEVFVTGLPRAGTTLVLELLYGTGKFETFTYRDMPFILAPLIWSRLSSSFRKEGTKIERAHGDGMTVSFDSPEAFEEVIWLAYLRDSIVGERTLAPLSRDSITEEFSDAMRGSIRKLLARSLHSDTDSLSARYLSKNNANISRIDAITKLFPTATVLVVFREPAAHIGSLMTQHARFLQEHAADAFSRRYMKWIGHYEFGENFRPINFSGWLNGEPIPSTIDETFWLRYWTAAYEYALDHRTGNVHFVDFDRLLQEQGACLGRIAKVVGLTDDRPLVAAGHSLRTPTTKPIEMGGCPPEIRRTAQGVHAQLKSLAV
jgi:hypothetical protein